MLSLLFFSSVVAKVKKMRKKEHSTGWKSQKGFPSFQCFIIQKSESEKNF